MRFVSTLNYGRDLNSIDQLTENDVLHIYDLFDYEYISALFAKKGRPKYIVTDHGGPIDYPDIKIYSLPLFAADAAEWVKPVPNLDIQPRATFNFLLNKKQLNRFLCLKFVEFFGLTNYEYTHSGYNEKFDMSEIIQELDLLGDQAPLTEHSRGFILSPSTIPPKFYLTGNDDNAIPGVKLSTGHNIYGNHQQAIIENSMISLITESSWGQGQCGAVITEKTLFPVIGKTLPIWIGGWQQANSWQHMGFDVFNDVINHNYQNYKTQIERCYYAFADNLELLSNYEKTAKLHQQLMPRLQRNRELVLTRQLTNYSRDKIANWPADLQSIELDLIKLFPHIKDFF